MKLPAGRFLRIVLPPIIILFIVFVGDQISDEITWTLGDYGVAFLLIAAASWAFDLISLQIKERKHRIFWWALVVLLFVLIWAELAVGLF